MFTGRANPQNPVRQPARAVVDRGGMKHRSLRLRPRRARFRVVVTSPELELLEAAAERQRLTLEAFVHESVLLAIARGSTR